MKEEVNGSTIMNRAKWVTAREEDSLTLYLSHIVEIAHGIGVPPKSSS
jgi:hypothetical protein